MNEDEKNGFNGMGASAAVNIIPRFINVSKACVLYKGELRFSDKAMCGIYLWEGAKITYAFGIPKPI